MKAGYLPGDGIGPEVLGSAKKVLELVSPDIEFVELDIGQSAYDHCGDYLPKATLKALEELDVALLGAVTSPSADVKGYVSVIPALRRHFDLYANLRPARSILQPKDLPLGKPIDIVVVRENTEGLYSQIEEDTKDGVVAHKVVTRKASERICRFALDLAVKEGRKKLTCVHKANVLRRTDGLFREVFFEMAKDYDLEVDECFIDAAAMYLVREPERFDVIVTQNLYGDILSDLLAGLAGGMGYAPAGNIGDDLAVFEPVHGSAPDIAGEGIANPSAAIICAAMLLEHTGSIEMAQRIREALIETVLAGHLTKDSGGALDTAGFTDQVLSLLR